MASPTLSDDERTRLSEAVRRAEAKTAGEIYVVVARTADEFRFGPLLWAALLALLLPWPLYLFTELSLAAILVAQAGAFTIASLVLSHPELRYRLIPPRIAAEASRDAAMTQFLAHGIHLTEARTGVLIYVALAQRRVEIVADAGIHAKVAQATWDDLAGRVVSAAKARRLADGLAEAIAAAGTILAIHFPRRPNDQNELPDHVIVM